MAILFLFYFRETEREREHERGRGAERERERERERESQADSTLSKEPNARCDPTTLGSRAEIKSQMLNRLSHPGAPGMAVPEVPFGHRMTVFAASPQAGAL